MNDTNHRLLDIHIARSLYKKRKADAHKGDFGHALIIAGSYGKMGAAILSTDACLRSGAGLVTALIPSCGYTVIQTVAPEAMVITGGEKVITLPADTDLSIYTTAGIGPGIGTNPELITLLEIIFTTIQVPIVIDADALNLIAAHPYLLSKIPPGSVLTPHPKEFERLFGKTANVSARTALAVEKADELNCVIVLKDHQTFVTNGKGVSYYNTSGNAGMATGGSGDVLTGLLTGLLAQGYDSFEAALTGVFLHGLAGDNAAHRISMEAMKAGDITAHFGDAFLNIADR